MPSSQPPGIGSLVGNTVLARTLEDGRPVRLPSSLDVAAFKKQTSVVGSKRGESLSALDTWLKSAGRADTYGLQQYAIRQVVDAGEHWLGKHLEGAENEKRSVRLRRATVQQVVAAARQAYGGTVPPLRGRRPLKGMGSEEDDDLSLDVTSESFESVASGSGITGDFADRNLVAVTEWEKANPDKIPNDPMSVEGGAKVNQPTFDVAESANLFTGGLGVLSAMKGVANEDNDDWDDAEALAKLMESGGKIGHGGLKLVKGIAIFEGGDPTEMTQVGDIGASFGDGFAFLSGYVTFLKGFRDAYKKHTEQGGLTGQEKLGTGLEQTEQFMSMGQSQVKTGLDVTKAATEVGATEAITALSTAAAAIGLVVGTIQTVRGGIQVYQACAKKNLLAEAEEQQRVMLIETMTMVAEAKTASDAAVRQVVLEGGDIDLDELLRPWTNLQTTYGQMVQIQKQYGPAIDAMKKLQDRQMEEGAFKMAKGSMGIVSSALLLSGVGAPIAIGVAAIGAIIALSEAGLKLARNHAASRLTLVARRLTDGGIPKGKADWAPSYREMETRINAAYYTHLTEVVGNKKPLGFKQKEFADVKNFVWEEKKANVSSKKKHIVASVDDVRSVPIGVARTHWIEVQEEGGATLKEKPKKFQKVVLTTSASAHKSSPAMEASRDDVVEALFDLGTGSFNGEIFANSPVVPVGDADQEIIDAIAFVTTNALLASADITPERWAAWVRTADGSEKKLRSLIRDQLP